MHVPIKDCIYVATQFTRQFIITIKQTCNNTREQHAKKLKIYKQKMGVVGGSSV